MYVDALDKMIKKKIGMSEGKKYRSGCSKALYAYK